MRENYELNVRSVEQALTQGYITSKEAEHMLKVYLHDAHTSTASQSKLKEHASA